MSEKTYNHFEHYEWIGSFSTPDRKLEFPGKLTYIPEDGIDLEFMCPMIGGLSRYAYLHGFLADGKNTVSCTLFGDFNPDLFGFNVGVTSIYQAKIKFNMVILGVKCLPTDDLLEFNLDLTNFQEFCHPQSFKDIIRFSKDSIFIKRVDDLEINLKHKCIASQFLGDMQDLFICDSDDLINKINDCFFDVMKNHVSEQLYKKHEVSYELKVKSDNALCVCDLNAKIILFEDLLSLLLFQPVRRSEISLLFPSEEDHQNGKQAFCLTSLFDMSPHKIKVLKKENLNFFAPITLNKIDFSDVIGRWISENEKFKLYATKIKNKFGRIHEHELHAEIVLLLTQLESIHHSSGKKNEKEKYDAPLKFYDKFHILIILKDNLLLNDVSEVGKALGALRGEIAHVGKPIKLLKKLDVFNLFIICLCLDLVITSHIYEKLGIAPENIKKFQEKHLLNYCNDEIKNSLFCNSLPHHRINEQSMSKPPDDSLSDLKDEK